MVTFYGQTLPCKLCVFMVVYFTELADIRVPLGKEFKDVIMHIQQDMPKQLSLGSQRGQWFQVYSCHLPPKMLITDHGRRV